MKKSTTKRALLMSVLSMFLCFTMLIGTTFAWFTDEVESGMNTIVAGNLDVELYNGLDDTAEQVKDTTVLFDGIKLWEPGAVVYENLTVANKGTLALKYTLSVNIDNAQGSKNLADVLKIAVVEGGITTETREDLIKLNYQPFASFTEKGELEAGTENNPTTETYGIVIWWEPSDKDNDYNMNNDKGDALSVDIGVNLFATQLEAENDSFGNDYDAKAPASVWNGVVPATMPDSIVLTLAEKNNQGGTITVKDAAGFVYLNKLADDFDAKAAEIDGFDHYYYHWLWEIELVADIDLNNYDFNTVALNYFASFNGNGHTISNVVMADGQTSLFSNGTVTNLYVEDITVNAPGANSVGAIIGNKGYLNNVHVENATVTGNKYVGGLAGKCSSIINCSIADSSVVGANKTVGGLAGYSIGDPNAATVKYNTVENVTVVGAYNVGGLLGQAQNEDVFDNTVKDVKVVTTAELPADADPDEVLSGAVVARNHAANVGENTVVNVDAGTGVYAASNTELANASKKDATIVLAEGTYTFPKIQEGMTIIGTGNVEFTNTLSGTLNNTTIKNVHIKAGNAQRWAYSRGNVVFENCTFEATSVYAIHYDGLNGATITYKDCTIIGWAAIGNGATHVTFDGCTIKGNGTYGLIRLYSEGTIKNCTFDVADVNTNDIYQDGIHAVDCTITVENITNVNGEVDDLFNVSGTGKIDLK